MTDPLAHFSTPTKNIFTLFAFATKNTALFDEMNKITRDIIKLLEIAQNPARYLLLGEFVTVSDAVAELLRSPELFPFTLPSSPRDIATQFIKENPPGLVTKREYYNNLIVQTGVPADEITIKVVGAILIGAGYKKRRIPTGGYGWVGTGVVAQLPPTHAPSPPTLPAPFTVTASELGAVMGKNPYKSRASVAAQRKVRQNLLTGIKLESSAIKLYEDTHHVKIVRRQESAVINRGDINIRLKIDGVITDSNNPATANTIIEIKNRVTPHSKFTEDCHDFYQLVVQIVALQLPGKLVEFHGGRIIFESRVYTPAECASVFDTIVIPAITQFRADFST